jgi:CheY-like chemotaxis protein
MIRNVMIVDDDKEMLLSLKEGLERHFDTFRIVTADDGLTAVDKLKEDSISLVVSDLKMPRMDGFSLLAHIMEHYPDIPVIIITGYGTPEMESLAREGGAVGYIAKPFMIEDLARKIVTALRKESEGGTLHSVSSGMFLQLIEMEQKTCTIRLVDKKTGKQGVLFFHKGELFDARVGSLQGEAAAYQAFSWDDVTLSIQNDCPQRQKRIHTELQTILLDSTRLKDEAASEEEPVSPSKSSESLEKVTEVAESDKASFIGTIRRKLEVEIGEKRGFDAIYEDSSWDALVAEAERVGGFFHAGNLKLMYMDRGESRDLIVLPGRKTTVISVNNRCPRDRVVEVVSDHISATNGGEP